MLKKLNLLIQENFELNEAAFSNLPLSNNDYIFIILELNVNKKVSLDMIKKDFDQFSIRVSKGRFEQAEKTDIKQTKKPKLNSFSVVLHYEYKGNEYDTIEKAVNEAIKEFIKHFIQVKYKNFMLLESFSYSFFNPKGMSPEEEEKKKENSPLSDLKNQAIAGGSKLLTGALEVGMHMMGLGFLAKMGIPSSIINVGAKYLMDRK